MSSARERQDLTTRRDRAAGWWLSGLLAIACLAWLPGLFSLPPLDRDESRFAQASRQMVLSGNYLDIRLGDVPRYNKPIGIYWLQAATADVARMMEPALTNRIWIYRLPSFFCGLLCLGLIFFSVREFTSSRTAFAAAALLAVTVLLSVEAEIATTDAALLACVTGVQTALLRIRTAFIENRKLALGTVLAGWAALGAGILVKGPVILAVMAATIASLCLWTRDGRWLKATRPLAGIFVTVGIVLPWAVGIGILTHGAFYQQSLGNDFAAKLVEGRESHGALPGYYLVLLSATFWPATLFLLPAFEGAWRARTNATVQFLICWAGSCFLLFELVPTKLPHYILPAYPALAILVALWIEETVRTPANPQTVLKIVSSTLFAFCTIAVGLVPLLLPSFLGAAAPPWTFAAAILGAIAGAVAVIGFFSWGKTAALAASIVCALILYPMLVAGVAPQLNRLWISNRVASMVERFGRPHDPPLVSAGYAEPSLLFLLGGETKFSTGEGSANIASANGGLALVEDHERAVFLARASQLKAFAAPLGQFSGLDYSRGKEQHFTIYRVDRIPLDGRP